MTHVLITGSTRGIGRASALRFGRDRATVSINYTQNAAAAEAVVAEIAAAGGDAAAFKAGLADLADVTHFLCSPAARWVNARTIQVNGGLL